MTRNEEHLRQLIRHAPQDRVGHPEAANALENVTDFVYFPEAYQRKGAEHLLLLFVILLRDRVDQLRTDTVVLVGVLMKLSIVGGLLLMLGFTISPFLLLYRLRVVGG